MRGDRRSTAKEVLLWWVEEEEEEEEEEKYVVVREDEAWWKCWKHHSQPRYGVCPACLRDRLLRLCPDCANVRPCGCFPFSSSSSSSFSSLSSAELARSGGGVGGRRGGGGAGFVAVGPVSRLIGSEPEGGVGGRGGVGAGIGTVGSVSRLIESEPAFRRSRSAGFQLLRSRSAASAVADVAPSPRPRGGKGWGPFWPFWRAAAGRKEPAEAKLNRSRSVAAERSPDAGGGEEGGRVKGWRRHFQSPMKVFLHRKSTTKVAQERSPLWRG